MKLVSGCYSEAITEDQKMVGNPTLYKKEHLPRGIRMTSIRQIESFIRKTIIYGHDNRSNNHTAFQNKQALERPYKNLDWKIAAADIDQIKEAMENTSLLTRSRVYTICD
ncbi:hypothetical protein RF11_08914 [Thelohanellus kitauei]|uniref:Uncharacterized protein n=1 Tax=Thelohanellus kitauei TaxID=669202 RepID=A0A0C2JAW2_THEKT|nr:hypothetical protein RF11_08914 [Thelohanellus kitauei]